MFFYRGKTPINICFYIPKKIRNNQVQVKCINKSLRNCPSLKFLKGIIFSHKYRIANKKESHSDKVINVIPVRKDMDSFYNVYVMNMMDAICSKCKYNVKNH